MPGLYGSSGLSTLPLFFFHFRDGIPLTNADVVACVHQTLYEADLVHHTTLAKVSDWGGNIDQWPKQAYLIP